MRPGRKIRGALATFATVAVVLTGLMASLVEAQIPAKVSGPLRSGDLDPTFTHGGRRFVDFPNSKKSQDVRAMVVDRKGRILLAGGNEGSGRFSYVARLLPNGELDRSFGVGGRLMLKLGYIDCGEVRHCHAGNYGGNTINSIALQPNGRIVLAGVASRKGTQADEVVVRLLPDGHFDRSFSGDGKQYLAFTVPDVPAGGPRQEGATSVALTSDGGLIVGGYANTMSGIKLVRLTPRGEVDPSFSDAQLPDAIRGTACIDFSPLPDPQVSVVGRGKVLVMMAKHGCVARLNADGTPDQSFGTGGIFRLPDVPLDFRPSTLLPLPGGKVLVGGSASPKAFEPTPQFVVERLTRAGALDKTFGQGGIEALPVPRSHYLALGHGSLARTADGHIVFAGVLLVGRKTPVQVVSRIGAGGRPDRTFAGDGFAEFHFPDPGHFPVMNFHVDYPRQASVAVTKHGIVVGAGFYRKGKQVDFAVARLLP